jgi:pimeloyl-ACP methyl ester carboxylesterase
MVQKKVLLPGAGVGLFVAGGLVGRQLVKRWRSNPDPLDGRPVVFPDGQVRRVDLPDGATIHTETIGHGPTIVMVHGLTASRHDWGPTAPALVDAGFQAVAVDQRGHGDSTAGTAGFGSSQLAQDLAFVFEALDLHARCLVGHSMGGMAAMAFAVEAPTVFNARVESLALIATAGSLATARHRLGLRLGGIAIPEALVPAEERMRVGAGLGVFGAAPSLHMIDEAIRSFGRSDEDVRTAATTALLEHDVIDSLGTVSVPTLVIGAGRDQLIRPHQVAELAAAIPGSRSETFPDAGHMVIWERHEEIAALLAGFATGPS